MIHESSAETAKKLRKELKKVFPDYPANHFSVRSSTYSGGSSVSVRWTDYPLEAEVNAVTKKYASASFDGMTDMKTYTGYEYEGKRYNGADYILTSRDISDERREVALEFARDIFGEGNEKDWEYSRKIREVEQDLSRDLQYTGRHVDVLKHNSKRKPDGLSEQKEEEITLSIEKAIKKLTTYGFKDMEYWHDSRITEVVVRVNGIEDLKETVLKTSTESGKSLDEVAQDIVSEKIQSVIGTTQDNFCGALSLECNKYQLEHELEKELKDKVVGLNAGVEKKGLFSTAYGSESIFVSKYVVGVLDRLKQQNKQVVTVKEVKEEIRTYVIGLTNGDSKEHKNWHSDYYKLAETRLLELPTLKSILNQVNKEGGGKLPDAINHIGGTILNEIWDESGLRVRKMIKDIMNEQFGVGGTVTSYGEKQNIKSVVNRLVSSSNKMNSLYDLVLGTQPSMVKNVVEEELNDEIYEARNRGEITVNSLKFSGYIEEVERELGVTIDNERVYDYIHLHKRQLDEVRNTPNFLETEKEFVKFSAKQVVEERWNKEIGGEDDLIAKEEKRVLLLNAYGWLDENGFKVDRNKVEEQVQLSELAKITTAGGTSESVLRKKESYVFDVCRKNIVSVVITDEDKKNINETLKGVLTEYKNSGKTVDLKGVKKGTDLTKIAELKKDTWGNEKFLENVKTYLTDLCSENVKLDATKPTPVNDVKEEGGTVTVNGIDIKSVISELQKGLVTLTFEKADKTLRTMIATRSEAFAKGIDALNTEDEINKQIGKGTIPVWDVQKNDMRAFNVLRLKSYTVNGETVDVDKAKEEVMVDVDNHFDPTILTTEQMLNILGKSVVRLVFQKKDGTYRVMWGTRDTAVIEMYSPVQNPMLKKTGEDLTTFDSYEKRQAQISGDYVKLFDVTVNQFRTFKPSSLLRMDEAHNVSSWIEFKSQQDGWYNCVNGGESISKYYEEGTRKAKESGVRGNSERVKFERDKQREIDEANFTRKSLERNRQSAESRVEHHVEQSHEQGEGTQKPKEVVSERKARWDESGKKVWEAVATIGEYTEQDEEVYLKMKKFVDDLRDKFIDLQAEGRGRGEIKAIKKSDKKKMVTFGYEEDMYILNPRFVLNGVSQRVFADRTGVLEFEGASKSSEGDTELAKELAKLATLVTGRRVKNKLDFTSVEDDVRRLNRFMRLSNTYSKLFKDNGIAVKAHKMKSNGERCVLIAVNGKRFLSAPAILYNIDADEVIYKRDRHTATLAEFRDSVISPEQLGIDSEAYNVLVGTIIESYDLRKRVRDEKGEAV